MMDKRQNIRVKALPCPDAINKMAKSHLEKMKVGAMFDGFETSWFGQEAYEFLSLIDLLCRNLDVYGPEAIEVKCAQRMEQLGIREPLGSLMLRKRRNEVGAYKKLMQPNCDLLRQGLASGRMISWNGRGCEALFALLSNLVRLVTVVIPSLIARAEKADPSEIEEIRLSL